MDMHGIDLNLLVAFDALIAERSVTRAGARIGRTQPAMSAALSRLRALFGDELFVRAPAGLQPTPRALDLAEPLGRALAEIERTLAFTQSFEPRSSAAIFSVGLSEHPAHVLLPRLVERLQEVAPAVVLRIRSFTARDDAVVMLDAGEIDMALASRLRTPRQGSSPAHYSRSNLCAPFVVVIQQRTYRSTCQHSWRSPTCWSRRRMSGLGSSTPSSRSAN
jgi:DNA-binding transcriptional LysR family regulator